MIEMKKSSIKTKTSKTEVSPLGPLVAKIIVRHDLKQNELSREVGMTPSQISNFLSGQKDIRSTTFVSLLKVLGIDLAKLLRNEAGTGASLTDNLESQFQTLPESERDTLSEFIKVYQNRYIEEKTSMRQR